MAHIKNIRFAAVGKNEGCTCDRCGQYIRNIWTVSYSEGEKFRYGIDCFEKIYKGAGMNAYGVKTMKKILKSIENYENRLEAAKNATEDTDEGWKATQAEWNKNSYWYGREYSEYKAWLINEFFPYRISLEQKELEKFRKVNFEA